MGHFRDFLAPLDPRHESVGQPGRLREAVAVAAPQDEPDALVEAHPVADADVNRPDPVSRSENCSDPLAIVSQRSAASATVARLPMFSDQPTLAAAGRR